MQVNSFGAAKRKMIPLMSYKLGHSLIHGHSESWEVVPKIPPRAGFRISPTHKAPRKRLDPCPVARVTGGHSTANGKHDMQSPRAVENEWTSRRRTSVDKGKGSSRIRKQGVIVYNCLLYNYTNLPFH